MQKPDYLTDFGAYEDAINRVCLEFHLREFENIPENKACMRFQFPDLLLKPNFLTDSCLLMKMQKLGGYTVFKDHENLKLFISRS